MLMDEHRNEAIIEGIECCQTICMCKLVSLMWVVWRKVVKDVVAISVGVVDILRRLLYASRVFFSLINPNHLLVYRLYGMHSPPFHKSDMVNLRQAMSKFRRSGIRAFHPIFYKFTIFFVSDHMARLFNVVNSKEIFRWLGIVLALRMS